MLYLVFPIPDGTVHTAMTSKGWSTTAAHIALCVQINLCQGELERKQKGKKKLSETHFSYQFH
jgi:hypothetical protein